MKGNSGFKPDMEKVFAGIVTFAVMVALVFGIVSIVKKNNEIKKEYDSLAKLEQVTDKQVAELPSLPNKRKGETSSDVGEAGTDAQGAETEIANFEKNTDSAASTEKSETEKNNAENASVASNETSNVATSEFDAAVNAQAENTASAGNAEVTSEGAEPAVGTEENIAAMEPAENTALEDNPSEQVAFEENAGDSDLGELPSEDSEGKTLPVGADPANILGYYFGDESTLMWPTEGSIIMNYNMENTVYFSTLDLYKCNPAILIGANEGQQVIASCDGVVTKVYEDVETGRTIEVSLGSGYMLTYGQLGDLYVGVGSQIKRGDVIATVAAPTSYYKVEGCNLYFRMDNANGPVNPMEYVLLGD